MGILRRLLGLQKKLSPTVDSQTPTTQPDLGETIPPREGNLHNAHDQAGAAASIEKKCALCGVAVESGAVACPECGKGLFESTQKARHPEMVMKRLEGDFFGHIEQSVGKLMRLLSTIRNGYETDPKFKWDTEREEVLKIGQHLFYKGNERLLVRVHQEIDSLGENAGLIEQIWWGHDGVDSWKEEGKTEEINAVFSFIGYSYQGSNIREKNQYLDYALRLFMNYYGSERLTDKLEVYTNNETRDVAFVFKYRCRPHQVTEIREFLIEALKVNHFGSIKPSSK